MAGDAALFTALAIATGPLALIVGPLAAWLLHGRRVTRAAAIGLGAGLVAGLAVSGAVMLALVGIGSFVEPIGGSEFAYPIALLTIAGALALIGLVALLADAVRDLAPARRRHVRLDVVRLAAAAILAVGVAAIVRIQTTNPASEIGDAGVFALAGAAVAGIAMLVGGRIQARLEGRSDANDG